MRMAVVLAGLAVLAAPAWGQDDPIAVRQTLMQNNAAAAGLARAVTGGEVDYSPVVGTAVVRAWAATAATLGDYFPEGSDDPERSRAAESIWEDREGFEAMIETFRAAVADAAEAGEDAEAFAAAVQPVLEVCGACHGAYRN